jgi:hypothetical protein
MNFSPKSFMPPKGTEITIKREMTLSERKMQGRKKYAKYVIQQLAELLAYSEDFSQPFCAKNYGSKYTIVFNPNNTVTVTIDRLDRLHFMPEKLTMTILDKGDGRFSFEAWLTQLDPCFGARLLKNLIKTLADQYSLTCQKRKEIKTKQLTKFESRTKQLRNLGFVSDAVGYSNDNYALTFKQITESPDAEWDAFINAISIVEKFTK